MTEFKLESQKQLGLICYLGKPFVALVYVLLHIAWLMCVVQSLEYV